MEDIYCRIEDFTITDKEVSNLKIIDIFGRTYDIELRTDFLAKAVQELNLKKDMGIVLGITAEGQGFIRRMTPDEFSYQSVKAYQMLHSGDNKE